MFLICKENNGFLLPVNQYIVCMSTAQLLGNYMHHIHFFDQCQ